MVMQDSQNSLCVLGMLSTFQEVTFTMHRLYYLMMMNSITVLHPTQVKKWQNF